MTTARAVIAAAALVALAIVGSAWWTQEATTAADRYQLVNVGGGQTHRLDKRTGDVLRCYQGACADITKGKAEPDEWAEFPDAGTAAAKPDQWPGKPVADIPAPPDGATLDKIPPPPEGYTLDQ